MLNEMDFSFIMLTRKFCLFFNEKREREQAMHIEEKKFWVIPLSFFHVIIWSDVIYNGFCFYFWIVDIASCFLQFNNRITKEKNEFSFN